MKLNTPYCYVIDYNKKILATIEYQKIENNLIFLKIKGSTFGIKGTIKINPCDLTFIPEVELPKSSSLNQRRLDYYIDNFNKIIDILKINNYQKLKESKIWEHCMKQLAIYKNISWAI